MSPRQSRDEQIVWLCIQGKLTYAQIAAQFGMTEPQLLRLRKKLGINLNRHERVAANKAWNDLSYELRGNKGQPHHCPRHPEAVRFKMVSEIADGRTIAEAVDAARAFAWTEA